MTTRSRHLKAILTRAQLVALVEAALERFSLSECPKCHQELSGYSHYGNISDFVLHFVARIERGGLV